MNFSATEKRAGAGRRLAAALALAILLLAGAGPAAAAAPGISQTFAYDELDASITGTATAVGPDAPLIIKGTLKNNAPEMMMDMDLYLTVKRASGRQERKKRVFLGFVDQDEQTDFRVTAPAAGTISGFQLDFIYQVGEPFDELAPSYITIKVKMGDQGEKTPTSGAAPGK
jgi:hypothetical protein